MPTRWRSGIEILRGGWSPLRSRLQAILRKKAPWALRPRTTPHRPRRQRHRQRRRIGRFLPIQDGMVVRGRFYALYKSGKFYKSARADITTPFGFAAAWHRPVSLKSLNHKAFRRSSRSPFCILLNSDSYSKSSNFPNEISKNTGTQNGLSCGK